MHDECEYAPRVSAYHDGEVSEVEALEVSRHVAGCPACAAQLAFFGKVSSTFEAAPISRLGPEARQRLEELGEQIHAQSIRIKPSADVKWVRRLTAAAAVLFVVAAGKLVYEHGYVGHKSGYLTPAVLPHDRVAPPLPLPISDDQRGLPASPTVPEDKAVTNADFVAGHLAPKSPLTGPTARP
jgi:hypothetical protein